eukprot:scaffold83890_cov17-Prasinocladus_malaysianus.AAC.2
MDARSQVACRRCLYLRRFTSWLASCRMPAANSVSVVQSAWRGAVINPVDCPANAVPRCGLTANEKKATYSQLGQHGFSPTNSISGKMILIRRVMNEGLTGDSGHPDSYGEKGPATQKNVKKNVLCHAGIVPPL